MLVWGDLIYVPFMYSICGWSLADNGEAMSYTQLLLIFLLHVFGHYLFRTANWQKHAYRKLKNKARIWG